GQHIVRPFELEPVFATAVRSVRAYGDPRTGRYRRLQGISKRQPGHETQRGRLPEIACYQKQCRGEIAFRRGPGPAPSASRSEERRVGKGGGGRSGVKQAT